MGLSNRAAKGNAADAQVRLLKPEFKTWHAIDAAIHAVRARHVVYRLQEK